MAAHRLILLHIILVFFLAPITTSQSLCQNECGDVRFHYPLGIGEDCYFDKSFEVICITSSGSKKAILKSNNLELSSMDLSEGPYFFVNISVISLNSNKWRRNTKGVNLSGSPFSFPQWGNMFAAIGCDNFAMINNLGNNNSTKFGKCFAICTCDPTQYKQAGCCDFLCTIPPNSEVFNANTAYKYSERIPHECTSVSMVEKRWLFSEYQTNSSALRAEDKVPALLEWGQEIGTCHEDFTLGNKRCNLDNYCLKQLGSGYICLCDIRRSNLYQDICEGTLICNTTSSANCSQCPYGYHQDPSFSDYQESPYCEPSRTYARTYAFSVEKKSRVKFIIIGCTSGGLGMLLLIIGAWWLYKFIKRRREMKRKQKFFKRNGGLLLQQELSTKEGNVEKTKVFTSKDLERATDNFNSNRILGQGGQGTVYKGMLEDGRIVAVKKSKVMDESKVEEFINEMVILSQINHRNVVKLLGCCLETEVPLLVYEFIPNGNLFEYIHDQIQEFQVTWQMRLRIAVEVSGAISYLHSAASIPIYHRDIKSTNILLDDKYRAKVSDFGTSRSMAIDQTHLTTQVHGTFGYLDPEYFRSSQFTEKSDVYSFGVVLAELLTGEKPIRLINSEEDRSLAAHFLLAMKENRLFEILDARVLKEAEKNEIITVANIAKRYLNLNGKKRPTMKELAIELAGITTGTKTFVIQEVIDSKEIDITSNKHFEVDSTFSRTGSFVCSNTFSVDVDPLISYKW